MNSGITDGAPQMASPGFFHRREYDQRLERLRSRMDELGLDMVVVSAPENIFYLTGYQTKAVFTLQLLILNRTGAGHLVTRAMESRNAALAAQSGGVDGYTLYRDDEDPMAVAVGVIGRVAGRSRMGGGPRAGMELGSWTMTSLRYQDIAHGCPSVNWIDVTGVIDRIRLVKSVAELMALRQAAEISDRIADRVCATLAPGQSENDATRVVMDGLITEGSEYPGSWPNVLVGRRTGLIHAAWSGERIQKDDVLTMEITGVKERYHAPCLRTILFGEPGAELRRAGEALTRAHQAAIAAMAPGRPLRVINDAATASLAGQELRCDVACRAGYSVGIGFPPSWGAQWQLSLNSTTEIPLEVGMTFHVVLIAHFETGRAIGLGRTVALLSDGPVCWTKGSVSTWAA